MIAITWPVRRRRPLVSLGIALGAGMALLVMLVVFGFVAAFVALRAEQTSYAPSAAALAEIPKRYLRLYTAAGERYQVDPWVLAAIGYIETQHGQSTAAGVHEGVNFVGCCAGPMQFSVIGMPSTWDSYGVDGDDDGRKSPYEPADAIPAAARYLRASGAPEDYRAALFAYNHSDTYVAKVLAKANEYRGAAKSAPPELPATGQPRLDDVLRNPRIGLEPGHRADMRAGLIDPRVIAILATIGRRYSVIVTSMRSDHDPGTNHEHGRAIDIGTVDGELCRGTTTGVCAQLARQLARITGPLRSTELIYCFDPDGPQDPRGFARSDHCDHLHVGWDA